MTDAARVEPVGTEVDCGDGEGGVEEEEEEGGEEARFEEIGKGACLARVRWVEEMVRCEV